MFLESCFYVLRRWLKASPSTKTLVKSGKLLRRCKQILGTSSHLGTVFTETKQTRTAVMLCVTDAAAITWIARFESRLKRSSSVKISFDSTTLGRLQFGWHNVGKALANLEATLLPFEQVLFDRVWLQVYHMPIWNAVKPRDFGVVILAQKLWGSDWLLQPSDDDQNFRAIQQSLEDSRRLGQQQRGLLTWVSRSLSIPAAYGSSARLRKRCPFLSSCSLLAWVWYHDTVHVCYIHLKKEAVNMDRPGFRAPSTRLTHGTARTRRLSDESFRLDAESYATWYILILPDTTW